MDSDGYAFIGGRYIVSAGSSSRDLPLSGVVEVEGEKMSEPFTSGSWYLEPSGPPDREEWITMLSGRPVSVTRKRGQYTMEDSVAEMRKDSFIMKILYAAVENTVAKGFGGKKDYSDPDFRMMMESSSRGPLRSMQINGGIKDGLLQGMLEIANGHLIKGIIRIVRG